MVDNGEEDLFFLGREELEVPLVRILNNLPDIMI